MATVAGFTAPFDPKACSAKTDCHSEPGTGPKPQEGFATVEVSCAHDLSSALPPFLQLELTAKRHSDIEGFVCWSEFGTLPRSINCNSMEHKANRSKSRRNLMPASRSEWSEFGTVNGLAKLTLLAGFRAVTSEWPTIPTLRDTSAFLGLVRKNRSELSEVTR